MKIIDKKIKEKSTVESVLSTLRTRENVGNVKKGVNLLNIVQKLSQKRAKASDEETSEEVQKDPQKK